MLTNPWLPSWTYSSIREKRWWQRTQRRRRGQWWWFRTGFTTQILNCEAVSIFPHQDWHSDWQLRSGGFPITFHQIPAGFTTHFMISLSPTAQYSLRCFQVFHCSATLLPPQVTKLVTKDVICAHCTIPAHGTSLAVLTQFDTVLARQCNAGKNKFAASAWWYVVAILSFSSADDNFSGLTVGQVQVILSSLSLIKNGLHHSMCLWLTWACTKFHNHFRGIIDMHPSFLLLKSSGVCT